MNKLLKRTISIAMAATIAVPVSMGTGAVKEFSGIIAEAAYLSVSELVVTDCTTNSITISWQGDENANTYEIEYKDDSQRGIGWQTVGQTSDTTYTISGLKSGNSYDIRVTPSNTAGDYGYRVTYYNAETKISVMNSLKQDSWYHYIEDAGVSWEHLYAAEGYEYKFKNPAGKVIKKGKTTSNRLSFSVKNNNVYTFTIRAYQEINGDTIYTPWKSIKVFEQPWVKSAVVKKDKKSKKYLKVSWYKQKGADGYDVYVSKTKKLKSYKKVKSVGKNTTAITLKKFNKKKISGNYYVYIVSKVKTSSGTSKSGITYVWNTKNGGKSTDYVDK